METACGATGAASTVDGAGADDSPVICGGTRTAREAGLNEGGDSGVEDNVEGGIVNKALPIDGIDACPWLPARFFCVMGSVADELLSSPCTWFVLAWETVSPEVPKCIIGDENLFVRKRYVIEDPPSWRVVC